MIGDHDMAVTNVSNGTLGVVDYTGLGSYNVWPWWPTTYPYPAPTWTVVYGCSSGVHDYRKLSRYKLYCRRCGETKGV